MVYSKKGSIMTLEENGLTISINYDRVIGMIDEEINNSYIYTEGTKEKNLYFFNKKNIPNNEYVESLVGIKSLINNMFTTIPTINIFEFIPITKKGTFAKNRIVNIASPIAGLFINCDYYKYVETFSLQTYVKDEKNVEIIFNFIQSDVNKFEPLFFEDYTTPIIRTKLTAIKRDELKPGMIYSDEKQKKFFLYLGKLKLANRDRYHSGILKKSKTLLPITSFTKEEILVDVDIKHQKDEADCLKYECKYYEKFFTYVRLSKKEYEALKKLGKQEDFEEFIRDCVVNHRFYLSSYENPLRVFHEEMQHLENVKPFEIVQPINVKFIDNVSGPIFYGGLDKDYYTNCEYVYVKYE